jgi:type III restriction enzyme
MGGNNNYMSLVGKYPLPNTVDKITNLLENTTPPVKLTRKTILQILKKLPLDKQKQMLDNPIEFSEKCTHIIKENLIDQLVDGIKYTRLNDWYLMTQFEDEFKAWEEYLEPANKSVYSDIVYNSNIERDFVKDLENNQQVLLYFKLPSWFKVPTPLGGYNPDWAILWEVRDEHGKATDQKLYLVYETKGTKNMIELRPSERRKILCGKAHFEDELGINKFWIAKTAEDLP